MQEYKLRQFAYLTGLSEAQLRYWDKIGKLKALRRDSGIRYYTDEHLLLFCLGNQETADKLKSEYTMAFSK